MQDTMAETAMPSKVSTAKHKTVKHELHRMDIEKADNGGYSVTHHFRPKGKRGEMGADSYKPSQTHVFQSFTDMHGHLPKAFEEKVTPAASVQEGNEELPTSKKA
jgi:hypothetical protein